MLNIPQEAYEPQIVFTVPDAKAATRVSDYMTAHNLPFKPLIAGHSATEHAFVAHATAFGPLIFNGLLWRSVWYLHPVKSSNGIRRVDCLSLYADDGNCLSRAATNVGYWHKTNEAWAKASRQPYFYDPQQDAYYSMASELEGLDVA